MMSRDRSRSTSPVFRSRSRSPREWKRPERRGADRDRGADRQPRDPHAKIRLYISNLPYDVRWQDLKDLFREKVGSEVSFTQLYEGPDGKPSGSGVVEVRGKEVALKAIELLHRYEVKGRSIIVREEREKDRQRHDLAKNDGRGGDMSLGAKPSLMSGGNLLGAMGNANMMNLLNSGGLMGGSLGAGGLGGNTFSMQLLGQLGVELSCITNQVFVANLDYKVTVAKLEEIFKIAGNVIEVDLKTDKEGRSRGMGTIRFEHPIEAVQAIALYNGQCLYERQMGVRMDKWVDPIMQDIPRRLPTGLKAIGVGLGANGQPLLNIGEIANTIVLSLLTGQLNSTNLAMLGTNVAALGGIGMGAVGSNLLGLGSGLGGMTGVGNVQGMMGSSVGGIGGSLGGLGSAGSTSVGGGLGGLMGNSGGMGSGLGASGGSSGLGSGLTSPLGAGLSAGLSGMRGGMGGGMGAEGSLMSKGGGGGLGGLGGGLGGSLGGMSENRMSSMSGADMYSSLGSSMAYDRGGSMDRLGGGYDRGLDRADSYGKSTENCTIFVRNLPFSFNWQNLVEKFRDCGDIKLAEIKMDNGRSRGCGIVQFTNSEAARRAINLMNGARLEGRQIEVRLDRLL